MSVVQEEWRVIDDFPNYMVSNFGRVKNRINNRMRSISVGKRGYPVVSLRKDNKTYLKIIHRLVAVAFIPNPNDLPQVNHIDGIKTHSYKSNLEWVSSRDNNLHARRTGLHKSDGDRAVMQIDKSNNVVNCYKSVSEASRVTNITRCTINAVLHGYVNGKGYRHKTAGGYKWRYLNE